MPSEFTAKSLSKSITEAAEPRMMPFRRFRLEAMTEYVGQFYNKSDRKKRPLNLINRGINVVLPHLATNAPRDVVGSRRAALRGEADLIGIMLAQLGEEIDRVRLSRIAVFEALVSPGAICRVGQRVGPETVIFDGKEWNLGQPGSRILDLDDYGCDPAARNDEELLYDYERIRLPKSVALESGIFAGHEDLVSKLGTLADGRIRKGGGKVDEMSGDGEDAERYGLVDLVEFYDVAIYGADREVRFVTIPAVEGYDGPFLRDDAWGGSEQGPFLKLCFFPIPSQTLGCPWVAHAREQNETLNRVLGKVVRQVENTKRLLIAAKGTSQDDIDTLKKARDGEVVFVDGIPSEMIQAIELGGVAKELLGLVGLLTEWTNVQGGNLDILGGTGSEAKTATEFTSLQASANVILDDMARTHEAFQAQWSKALAWYPITDPLIQKPLTRRIAGGEFIDLEYSAESREGAHQDFTFNIRHRSTGRQDPNARARRLTEFMGLAMQSAEASMATGGAWDTTAFLRIMGEELQIDEIDELWKDPVLAMRMEALLGGVPPMPAQGQPVGQSRMNPEGSYRPRQLGAGGGGASGIDAVRGAMAPVGRAA